MSAQPEPNWQNDFGSLQGCFVEGSSEQRAHERSIRRRALIISIALQSAILTAIILVPLFGKPERIALAMTPIPPYFKSSAPERLRPTTHSVHPAHQKFLRDMLFANNSQPSRYHRQYAAAGAYYWNRSTRWTSRYATALGTRHR